MSLTSHREYDIVRPLTEKCRTILRRERGRGLSDADQGRGGGVVWEHIGGDRVHILVEYVRTSRYLAKESKLHFPAEGYE